ncbi:MAG: AAA family ATPase, partial [Chloroflexota bacterium]|nr:AAA family ATPase [Chloroflexota bacterium]
MPPDGTPVTAEQKFTRENPCPVCVGGHDDERGIGKRCWGYLSWDGKWAYCTREEYAGGLSQNPQGGTYALIGGGCACGRRHDVSTLTVAGNRRHASPRPTAGSGETIRYDVRNEKGQLLACHVRRNLPDGQKQVWWEQPDGRQGLGGRQVADLPLYRLPELLAAPLGSPVIVCEGEKAADALTSRGILAVGTVTGAGTTPSAEVLRPLLNYDVILWSDNDKPGRQHMARVVATLRKLGGQSGRVVREIRWADAPEKGDAHDFFEQGGTAGEINDLIACLPIDDQAPIDTQHLRMAIYEDDGHVWSGAGIVRLSDVRKEKVRWLWPGRVPLGKLTVIDGDPGLGKSLVTLDTASRVSRGRPMPDGSTGDLDGPAGVVLLTAE